MPLFDLAFEISLSNYLSLTSVDAKEADTQFIIFKSCVATLKQWFLHQMYLCMEVVRVAYQSILLVTCMQ